MNRDRVLAVVGVTLFALSVALIAIAPALLDGSYSPLANSISEAAAQQTTGAWAARLALLLSGLGVVLACIVRASHWGVVPTAAYALFGLFWMLTAVFSTRSWLDATAFDEFENTLHSVFATAMAVIIVGALVLLATNRTMSVRWRWATWGLVVAATLLPLFGVLVPEFLGVSQRLMFAAAYAWFGVELWRHVRADATPRDA